VNGKRYIHLATVADQYQAQFLREALEESDINCLLSNQVSNHWLGTEIDIRIPEEDQLRAVKVYQDLKARTDQVTCPNCDSEHVEFGVAKKYKKWWPVIVVLFLVSPLIPPANSVHAYTCKDCDTEFRKNKY
jgi:hypothetical protein